MTKIDYDNFTFPGGQQAFIKICLSIGKLGQSLSDEGIDDVGIASCFVYFGVSMIKDNCKKAEFEDILKKSIELGKNQV